MLNRDEIDRRGDLLAISLFAFTLFFALLWLAITEF